MSAGFDPHACRVAILAGGKSDEREISLASGEGARAALEQAGFPYAMLDPADRADLKRLLDEDFDVAFLCMHGKYGEDGTLQGMLELIGIPYTGPGVWSSATAMDKAKSKIFYERAGVATPPSATLLPGDEVDVPALMERLGRKCVVKPATEGSAIGVFIVEGEKAIEQAIAKAFEIDAEVLVERYIKGREYTVAVLGNDDAEALPVIEIVPKSDFYDFESKYAEGGSQHICPADLPNEVEQHLKDMAVRAHKALACEGISRSDIIIEDDGRCWLLETNTLPGMTATSLLPDAARAAGITFPELCTRLVRYALER